MRLGPLFPLLLAAALATGAALAGEAHAEPVVIERVIAVVGNTPILRSELQERAAPFLQKLGQHKLGAAEHAQAEQQLFRDLLDRLIDDVLVAQAADKARVTTTSQEVDAVLKRMAEQNSMSIAALLAEAASSGYDAAAYRDEIRRQLLEGKMLQLRLRAGGAPRLTGLSEKELGERLEREKKTWLGELRKTTPIDVRLVVP